MSKELSIGVRVIMESTKQKLISSTTKTAQEVMENTLKFIFFTKHK